jgi:chitinase
MSYDFYEIPLKFRYAMHHSQFLNDSTNLESYSQTYSIQNWMQNGFHREKIQLGLSLYARTFLLFVNRNCNPGSKVHKEGRAGEYTKVNGILSYYEICQNLLNSKNGWTRKWDEKSNAPYACCSKENEIAFYEDTKSILIKTVYAKVTKLGGISLFSLDMDDFNGKCNEGRFPLSYLAKEILLNY